MNRLEALKKLRDLQKPGDPEAAHCYADDVLCDFLTSLGFRDVVEAWDKVDKWYA